MKTLKFIPILLLIMLAGCTPDKIQRFDNSDRTADSIFLTANHTQLIADGVSRLDLEAKLFSACTYPNLEGRDTTIYGLIPKDRIKPGRVQYFLADGTSLKDQYYTTTDASKTSLTFYAETDGVRSNDFSITVREPFDEGEITEIVYPVIFHVIESKEVVDFKQGVGDDYIYHVLRLMNNVFGRHVSLAPNGANPKITFRPAEYDPNGAKLAVKGISRTIVPQSKIAEFTTNQAILDNPKVTWDHKRYLNIWIVHNKSTFAMAPYVVMEGADMTKLQGVTCVPVSPDDVENMPITNINQIGVLFKAKDFATEDIAYNTMIGGFFGLLQIKKSTFEDKDFCADTFASKLVNTSSDANSRLKMTEDGFVFYSVNIMDESSFMTTISKDQVSRIRFVTENCPTRWSWKSDWAFTGQ